jgi:hypothetical protein
VASRAFARSAVICFSSISAWLVASSDFELLDRQKPCDDSCRSRAS